MRNAMPREFYIHKGASKAQEVPGAVVYTYEAAGAVYAQGFAGARAKPAWHHRFRSTEQRDKHIADFLEGVKLSREAKIAGANERAAKLALPMGLKVGAILVASWGYDQTNVDFYEVVEVLGHRSIMVRPIGSKMEPSSPGYSSMAGHCTACPGQYTGEAFRKRVGVGDYVKLTSYSSASPWSGRPMYSSWYA